MNIKLMIAGVVGIVGAVVITGASLVVNKESAAAEYTTADLPDIRVSGYAPSANIDPMTPVEEDEADRRATLHGENADLARAAAANDLEITTAFVAAPVVENIFSLGAPGDDLGSKLFGNLFTPEPVEEEIEIVLQVPEPEPELELVPVVEAKVEPEPVRNPQRDLLMRGGNLMEQLRVAPMEYTPNPTIRTLEDHSLFLDDNLLGLGLYLANRTARASVFDDSRAYQVADSTGTINLTDPVVMPPPVRTTDAYNGLPLEEHSPARPVHVVSEPGNSYSVNGLPGLPPEPGRSTSGTLIEFGEMRFASLTYGFNSDNPRGLPIIATMSDILPNGRSGPFDNAVLRGAVQYSENNASIVFDTARLASGEQVQIEAIAVAGREGTTGVADRVNRHVVARYGSLFLAGLIKGVGEVGQIRLAGEAATNPTIIVDGTNNTVNIPASDELSNGEVLAGALKPVGDNLSDAAARGFNRPHTISAPAGMPFAIVFVSTVTSEDIQR